MNMAPKEPVGEQPEPAKPEDKNLAPKKSEDKTTALKKSEGGPIDRAPTEPGLEHLGRKWLVDKSKDELIDIIIELKDKLARTTRQISNDIAAQAFDTAAFGTKIDTDVQEYLRLPTTPARRKREDEVATTWRLKLISSNPKHMPLGLEIHDDVFVGRSMEGIIPDLDLSEYDAEDLGVSRQHALLRPSKTSMFLIDLGSTNGTFCNGRKLSPGAAQKLKDKDTLSFGALHFSVRLVSQPKKPDATLKAT
jgi:hypothetical protein